MSLFECVYVCVCVSLQNPTNTGIWKGTDTTYVVLGVLRILIDSADFAEFYLASARTYCFKALSG
jgi:hypothetical protein